MGKGAMAKGALCPLGTAAEVPAYQRRLYICRYYRMERPCARHFWCQHNELGNMWTHILAGAYVAASFCRWLSEDEVATSLGWPRQLYWGGIVCYFFTAMLVFAISVQDEPCGSDDAMEYHWRVCSTEPEFHRWLCLDQSSCLALVVIGYFAGIPMGFHCHPWLQVVYCTVSVLVVCSMGVMWLVTPKQSSGKIVTTILIGTLFAIVPAVNWLAVSTVGRQRAGHFVVGVIVVGLVAAGVYLSRVPERWAPGRFDLVGSSHQWWHLLIFATVCLYAKSITTVFSLTATQEFCT